MQIQLFIWLCYEHLWAVPAVKLIKRFSRFAGTFSVCMCFLRLQRVELRILVEVLHHKVFQQTVCATFPSIWTFPSMALPRPEWVRSAELTASAFISLPPLMKYLGLSCFCWPLIKVSCRPGKTDFLETEVSRSFKRFCRPLWQYSVRWDKLMIYHLVATAKYHVQNS